MISKNVYFFGDKKAEGDAKMRETLGCKGANLAEMTNLGLPIPPGFTITTDVCAVFCQNERKYPKDFDTEVGYALTRLEKLTRKKLGDPKDPLLVSVRLGAALPVSGMMNTILNVGLNDQSVAGLAETSGNPRFAWDSYRRFIRQYGETVMGVPNRIFEDVLSAVTSKRKARQDTDLAVEDMKELADEYRRAVRSAVKRDFPQQPRDQLWGVINAVFDSWAKGRITRYQRNGGGIAVTVQMMVFGNSSGDSGTGFCLSRDPVSGRNDFSGEYWANTLEKDAAEGALTAQKLDEFQKAFPRLYRQLVEMKNRLERCFRDMLKIEFTVQRGKLYLLQSGSAERTGAAAIKCALDMVKEGIIDREQAVTRVSQEHLAQLLHPTFEPKTIKALQALTQGIAASPGAAAGRIVFTTAEAEAWHERGEKVLLVLQDTEDIGGMAVSQGVLIGAGGRASHAAVAARDRGIPCVAGAQEVAISGKNVKIGKKSFKEGDWISVDGTTGEVFEGELPLTAPKMAKETEIFLSWCDEVRNDSTRGDVKGFRIRTNADQPEDAKRAIDFGADGVGLCRTEYMFFEADKRVAFQAMIVAETPAERKSALKKLLAFQKKDFQGIFKAMDGKPVAIRLLDSPLHEFVPHTKADMDVLAAYLGVGEAVLQSRIDKLREQNPVLGLRGCRLAITYPEIYDMQVESIAHAAIDCVKKSIFVHPEIMLPMISDPAELALVRPRVREVWRKAEERGGIAIPFRLGAMIETPRAALLAKELAEYADFFSFGTNDLTQMTFAFSRDDAASFIPRYLDQGVLGVDPFKSNDESGVGALIQLAVSKGRETKSGLKCGICGEQGGDPAAIDFCYRAGLSYVSCSSFRVPLARLAGAQAVIHNA
jgi:pyruvate,orthophosphate dikinase